MLAFEHPEFADPMNAKLASFDYAQRQVNKNALMFEQYQWYVSMLLNACDAIRKLTDSVDWINTMKGNIGFHCAYIKSPLGMGYVTQNYSDDFLAFIEDACKKDP